MSDLISREAAIRDALDSFDSRLYADGFADGYKQGLKDAQPERNAGKWIEDDDAIIHGRCSCCGWSAIWQETDVFGGNFCPNCGADMRGET